MKPVSIVLLAGLVAGVSVQLALVAHAATYREKVLHSFAGWGDGGDPYAGVIDVKGTLYGTTSQYGGTIFSLDPGTGVETILYSFPYDLVYAPLLNVNNTLYGTTGGDADSSYGGTVFSIDLSTGVEETLYTFNEENGDGAFPQDVPFRPAPPSSKPLEAENLYGTTFGGGASGMTACIGFGCGTVFSLDPSTGVETVLYSFCSRANCADGQWPSAGLVSMDGTLFGTAASGGMAGCHEGLGCGTVFSIDPKTGVEKKIYTFCSKRNCGDGGNPFAGLIVVNGLLYGTTLVGGSAGGGTVYSIDPQTDKETVVHSFAGSGDGAAPEASLTYANGLLYGTTALGGSGGGTVFSLDPVTGAETVLYAFCSLPKCSDGQEPGGSVTYASGKLYGTTVFGGADGYGTVFELEEQR